MDLQLTPLRAMSLRDAFVAKFESLILSGEMKAGTRLPSERDLAVRMGVSRPVVHEALVELANRGLVVMKPRVGTIVNDYRREGSLTLLQSLLSLEGERWDPFVLQDTLGLRRLIESEVARLAAANRGPEDLRALHNLVKVQEKADSGNPARRAALDFEFHHTLALASGHRVYPMLIKSFEVAYRNLGALFYGDPLVWLPTMKLQVEMMEAVDRQDSNGAVGVMERMLEFGELHLAAYGLIRPV